MAIRVYERLLEGIKQKFIPSYLVSGQNLFKHWPEFPNNQPIHNDYILEFCSHIIELLKSVQH